jgi:serine/threonine protein kinase/TolB-like protein/Tfp pilus assembly protein PilF
MTPARLQTIEAIFRAALQQEPDQVGSFLDKACKDDDALRSKVEALLSSRQRADSFIETPAIGLATKIIQDGREHSLAGEKIGHYKISESIGSGGMGEVYLATDVVAGRKAAFKVLPIRFTADAERLKRFQQEARAVVGLNHPNILTVYEIGEDHSVHYIASELIEGETLRQRLGRGPMQVTDAVDVAIQVTSALAAAHQAGIVHRDIKPENIMLRPDGYVKVLDFSIAKLAEQELPVTIPRDQALLLVETNLGSVLGTVRYMSPEQALGAQVDKTTDIWSLGVVLYEILTGHAPFSGDTPGEVMSSILEKEPPPLANHLAHPPAELQRLITKTLRKDRNQRYRTAQELLEALKQLRRKLEFEAELESSTVASQAELEKAAEAAKQMALEIGHVLFVDIVGYSQLSINEQHAAIAQLTQIVRSTEQFRKADAAERLIKLATGDGMALVFYTSPDAPVRCAVEISHAVKQHPRLRIRMGIHSGPVTSVTDVTGRKNLAGAGLNLAQRIMDCGDAGHILVSKHAAEDLSEFEQWRPLLHDLGACAVKHGLTIQVVNLWGDDVGNPQTPSKLRAQKEQSRRRQWMLLGGAATSLALATAIFMVWHGARKPAASVMDRSIAVLPFENLSDNKENAYFAGGVQEEILNDLAKVADLKVISRASVLIYKPGSARNLREIGEQLGVAHVLEGSVQRAGAKVRVSAQLIDARTDKQIWAGTYDRELADVFTIETELAQAIAGELQVKLTTSEKAAIEEKPTQDLAAYDFYVHALSIIYTAQVPTSADLVNLSEAADLLDKAVARDPNFFLAYYHLAFAHDLIYQQQKDHTPARLALAKSAIDSALRLRPDSGEAHLALAWHLYWGNSEYDRARAEVALAQQRLPNNAQVFELAGLIDRRERHWADAIHNLERAGELDPRNLPYHITLATTYLWLHDYDQETRVLDRIIALHPERRLPRILRPSVEIDRRADTRPCHAAIEKILTTEPGSEKDPDVADWRFELALYDRDLDTAASIAAALPLKQTLYAGFNQGSPDFWLGVVGRLKGDVAAARAAFVRARTETEEELRIHPDDIGLLSDLGLIDAALGRKQEALSEGRRALELAPTAPEAMTGSSNNEGSAARSFAVICARVGETDLALEQLEAITKVPCGPTYGDLRLDPDWDALRGNPRFEKIVQSLAPKDAKQ